jgi:hypothetical protein
MPTLSLDRTLATLPSLTVQIAPPKQANAPLPASAAGAVTLHGGHLKEYPTSRIALTSDNRLDDAKEAENDSPVLTVEAKAKLLYVTASEHSITRTLAVDGASINLRENSRQANEDLGTRKLSMDKERVDSAMLEEQREQRLVPSSQQNKVIKPTQQQQQQPPRDRAESKRKDEQDQRKISMQAKAPPERPIKADEQCNFPNIIPLTAQPLHPVQKQLQGYTNQQYTLYSTKVDNHGPLEQRLSNERISHIPPNPLAKKSQPNNISNNNNNNNMNNNPIVDQGLHTTNPPASLQANHHPHIQMLNTSQPTLFFDRLVSEEVQEFKSYARIIESQSRRLTELESLHHDLEARLEYATVQRFEMEATLERQELEWTRKFTALENECDEWKKLVQTEQTKNERLLDLVYRKDREIQRMIQRKVRPRVIL